MCHSVTWYFAICQHQDPDATSLIACHEAYKKGYECTEEHQGTTPLPLEGSCLQCRLDRLMLRRSTFRELRRQGRWSAICDALQYNDEDNWSISESDAEELEMETRNSQSPSLTRRAESQETRASFHMGPCIPTLMQSSSPHLPHVPVVEYADDSAGHEEQSRFEPLQDDLQRQTKRSWRSRIPLPTRPVHNQQNRTYLAFIADDNISVIEPLLRTSKMKRDHRTWRSWIPLPVRKLSGP
ncbi:uncharacterized protein N7500_010899 [Penicillium coprophilum]|uniref:uncharacterized protein n=1 Tax=Penicillium coprophilum TaxID=36646 RepID=UPI00239AAA37|nr:uncharacterized protein N7500_010899 [Penicillium coprophilum]KAJ5150710.1 hypothetical protein N7500_010899 [Penicillium coprophilum]